MLSPGSRSRSYGGELPADEETLRSFKGIGAYTAGAVLSFAFGQRAAILDTNVARVLFRVFVGRGKPKAHAMRAHLWTLSRTLLPVRHVFDFNQALMDFGATLCTARKPKCLLCPMRADCAAYPFNPDNERAEAARRRCRGRRTRRELSGDATAARHSPRRAVGVSRRQMRAWRDPRRVPAPRDSRGARLRCAASAKSS